MLNTFDTQRESTEAPMADFTPRTAAGEHCNLGDLLQSMGVHSTGVMPGGSVPIALRRIRAGEALYHEGGPAHAVYFVRAGTFKSTRTAEDGYEQVLGFAGRAELLGFDALCTDCHPTSAVALEESRVYVVLVRDLYSVEQRMPEFGRTVHLAVSRALARRGELADVMAAVAAEVRLARFLMQLSHSKAACGESPRRFYLRMSRRDIASHLGVAHETVSRSFSALAGLGGLRVNNREVESLDVDALRSLARSTRRHVDDLAPFGPHMTLAASAGRARVACGAPN